MESLTDEAFSEIANFVSKNFDVPYPTKSDFEFDYNDFILAEDGDGNNTLMKSNKIKISYDNNLPFNKRRLKSMDNFVDVKQNYFSLSIPMKRNTLFKENKVPVACFSKQKEESNVFEVNILYNFWEIFY